MVHAAFIDLVRTKQHSNDVDMMPDLTSLNSDVQLDTQKRKVETAGGNVVSVLLTDRHWDSSECVVRLSDRKATYDGIISCPPDWTILIENKPNADNVWQEQLMPSRHSFEDPETLTVQPKLVVILWSELIERLTTLMSSRSVLGRAEALMVEDFLDLMDSEPRWRGLNPFTTLRICKDDPYRLRRRCSSILEELAPDGIVVQRGQRAGLQLTEFSRQRPCRFAWLGPTDTSSGNWELVLSLYPGDTINQARRFLKNVRVHDFFELRR